MLSGKLLHRLRQGVGASRVLARRRTAIRKELGAAVEEVGEADAANLLLADAEALRLQRASEVSRRRLGE